MTHKLTGQRNAFKGDKAKSAWIAFRVEPEVKAALKAEAKALNTDLTKLIRSRAGF